MKNNLHLFPVLQETGYKKLILAMKISFFFFLLATIHVSASVYSQNTSFDLSVKNKTMREVFKQIEQKSEFRFFYNDEFKDLDKEVSLNVSGKKIHDILDLLLEDSDVTYEILENNLIVITPYATLQHSVSGRVTSAEDGSGIPGVNVLIKGTTRGTVTDIDGNYQLDVSSEDAVLVISSVGYIRQEIRVGDQSIINVALRPDIAQLEEIVVIGYGEQERRDVTGSISSVAASEYEDEPITSLSQGIQGKVAGVNVTMSSGAPGANMIVRIRGNSSVIGSNDPLYVVDGVPITSGTSGRTHLLSTINPGDIESIEVLKDASATAIYGSRGSNGVILITTKQGVKDQQNIDFEASLGFRSLEKKIDMMNSSQFMEIANERQTNDGNNPVFSDQDINTLSRINTDWQDEIFRPALIQNYTLRFSGGNERTQYMISGNYFDEEGIIRASDFTRGSLRFNLDQELSSKFDLASRIMLTRSVNNEIPEESILLSALQAPPFLTVYNEDGSYVDAATLKQYPFSPSSGDNPVAVAEEQLNRRLLDRVLANISGNYEIIENLSAKVLLGVDHLINKHDFYNPRVLEGGLPAGSGSKTYSTVTSFLNENTLNYARELRENDRLNVIVGFTWQQEHNESLSGSASGFVTDDLDNNALGSGESFSAPNTGVSEWTLLSYLGRINYSLNDKYLFTLSGRRDGSSRFGEGNKWGFFPSGAFAWRLSEEGFIQNNITQISDLKARVSWGVSGNQAISPYQSLQRFSAVGLAFGGTPTTGFAPANLGNPDLKWETTEEFNIGLEFSLWDYRFHGSVDYYVKNTKDLLALVNLPPTAGFTTTLQNIGSTRNKGVEIVLGADIIRSNLLNWDVNFNIAGNKNTVTETAGGQDIIAPSVNILGSVNIIREGAPLSSFYGLKTDGLDENGFYNFIDQDGDGSITDADRVILGDPYADYFYGFATNLSYGNFSLRAFFQGELGKKLWNNNRYRFYASFHRGPNQIADVAENRWRPENPDPNAPYPRATSILNQNPSDWFIEDASYLRLQNLRIKYDLPVEIMNIPAFRSLSVYVSGQNLFTLTDYTWYTPDVSSWNSGDLRIGVDHRSYPTARTFSFGVKVGL